MEPDKKTHSGCWILAIAVSCFLSFFAGVGIVVSNYYIQMNYGSRELRWAYIEGSDSELRRREAVTAVVIESNGLIGIVIESGQSSGTIYMLNYVDPYLIHKQ